LKARAVQGHGYVSSSEDAITKVQGFHKEMFGDMEEHHPADAKRAQHRFWHIAYREQGVVYEDASWGRLCLD
jgi:hypothetical protein